MSSVISQYCVFYILFDAFQFLLTAQKSSNIFVLKCIIFYAFCVERQKLYVARFREQAFGQSHVGFYMLKTAPQMTLLDTQCSYITMLFYSQKTINIMLKIFLTTTYLVIDHSLDIIDATFYQLSALYIKHQVFEEKLNTRFIELCTNIQHSQSDQ